MNRKNNNSHSNSVGLIRRRILYARSIYQSLEYELKRYVGEEEGYIFENAKDFAGLLNRVHETLELNIELEYHRNLLEIIDQENHVRESETNQQLLRIYQRVTETIQIATELNELLKYVDGARSVANPWGIVSQLDRFCRGLHHQARGIVRPGWEYNYTYYPINLKLWRVSEYANAKVSRINTGMTRLLSEAPFYFSLAFPPITKPNLLQMAIWGHELGHFIDNMEGMTTFDSKDSLNYQNTYFSKRRAQEIIQNRLSPEVVNQIVQDTLSSNEAMIADVLKKYNEPIGKLVLEWAVEIFADLFSVHLFGPAAIFALVEFVQPLTEGKTKQIDVDSSYPPFGLRLELILQEYDKWLSSDPKIKNALKLKKQDVLNILSTEIERLKNIESDVTPITFADDGTSSSSPQYLSTLYPSLISVLKLVVANFSEYISRIKRQNPDCYFEPADLYQVIRGVTDLDHGLPPEFIHNQADLISNRARNRILTLVLNSGWLSWIKKQRSLLNQRPNFSEYSTLQTEFEKLNQLLLRAVENNEAIRWFSEQERFTEADPTERGNANRGIAIGSLKGRQRLRHPLGVLRREHLLSEIARGTLIIRPLLDPSVQIHKTSIDLRLGNEFIIMKRSSLTKLDPNQIHKDPTFLDNQSKYFIPFGQPFVLHPWQIVSTTCLEFLKLPDTCVGQIDERNWWTNMGLVFVGPQDLTAGFQGRMAFNITNLGNAPILLYPGSRICHLTLIPIR